MNLTQLLQQAARPPASSRDLRVTDSEWDSWQEQLLIDLICGSTMGQSFADYFDIQDLFLMYGNPPKIQVDQHINHYYR